MKDLIGTQWMRNPIIRHIQISCGTSTVCCQISSNRSFRKPVIIVQGDHGFWGDAYKRLPILNAYDLPGNDADQLLYPAITPVNSFRIVLNTYLNGQFELLPDKNYPTIRSKDYYDIDQAEQLDKGPIGYNPK